MRRDSASQYCHFPHCVTSDKPLTSLSWRPCLQHAYHNISPTGRGREPVRSARCRAPLGNCWFPPSSELILGGGQVQCPSFWLLSPILTSHPVGTRIWESGAPDSPAAWLGPWAKDWALPSAATAQWRWKSQSFAGRLDSVTYLLWASVASRPTHGH